MLLSRVGSMSLQTRCVKSWKLWRSRCFGEADTDGSGSLDREELAAVLREFYQRQGVSRSIKKVNSELDAAMREFDSDGSGRLELDEFVKMVCSETPYFRLKIDPQIKHAILAQMQLRRSESDHKHQQNAATQIQSLHRGQLARQRYKQHKQLSLVDSLRSELEAAEEQFVTAVRSDALNEIKEQRDKQLLRKQHAAAEGLRGELEAAEIEYNAAVKSGQHELANSLREELEAVEEQFVTAVRSDALNEIKEQRERQLLRKQHAAAEGLRGELEAAEIEYNAAVKSGQHELANSLREELEAVEEQYSAALRIQAVQRGKVCLLYTSPSPRDRTRSRMPSSA
eukprot:TRINITY_DN1863_c0_g1_i6.p1 TRINITY_DN1863_c0_g1~~TRINITY_DN1863_c0_g1_i6.p1  ORF type:complete len:341 (-),score=88.96 TRINITY_DN1863_c0_g1_i6:101-1123(-)